MPLAREKKSFRWRDLFTVAKGHFHRSGDVSHRNAKGSSKSGAAVSRSASWEGAGQGHRLRQWQGSSSGVNPLLHQHAESLRRRSRDLVRNNPYAANLVETWVSNVIGTGIKAQPKADDKAFRATLQSLWSAWLLEADADGVSDFYGLQARVCRSLIEGGECLVRLQVWHPKDDSRSGSAAIAAELPTVPLRLQVLEAEHLDASQDRALAGGGVIRGGIEFDGDGQRMAYHLYRTHPGECGIDGLETLRSVRVPASQVLHVYRMDRPGQIRGVPWLAPVLVKLHELDQYDDAELVRKKVAAIFAGFVTRLDPDSSFFGEGEANREGVALAGLEPGTLQFLDPGEDIKFSEPSDVGGNYLDFMRQQLRAIAAGVGVTYEQLSGDLTQVNYSSIRAGLIEFRRRCARLQHQLMVFQFCRPVWQRWLALAFISNAIRLPKNRCQYASVKWVPQGFEWVDPLKDQQAQQVAVRSGFKSRAEVVSALGRDVEEVDEESYRDHERAEALDLPFDSHVRWQGEVNAVGGDADDSGQSNKQNKQNKENRKNKTPEKTAVNRSRHLQLTKNRAAKTQGAKQ